MRYKKNNSTTIRIGIANEEKRSGSNTSASSKRTWKYSPLLRYFVHLMLVMDDGLPIDEDKP